jgi:hypothetical protein
MLKRKAIKTMIGYRRHEDKKKPKEARSKLIKTI